MVEFQYDLRHVGRFMKLAPAQEELLQKPRGFAMIAYQLPDPIAPSGLGVNGEAGYRALRDGDTNERILLPTVIELFDWDLVEQHEDEIRKLSNDYFTLPSVFGTVTDLAEQQGVGPAGDRFIGGVHAWAAMPLNDEQGKYLSKEMSRFFAATPYQELREWVNIVAPWGSRAHLAATALDPSAQPHPIDAGWVEVEDAVRDYDRLQRLERDLSLTADGEPRARTEDFQPALPPDLDEIWDVLLAIRQGGIYGLNRALPKKERSLIAKDHFSWP